jgi:hypothetical protein
MQVYAADNTHLGHIAEVYEDSFLIHKGLFLSKNRYIPYNAITTTEGDRVTLKMNAGEVEEMKWEMRPNYTEHAGDPTQLFYDRGHGVHDPFDESQPEKR